MTEYHVKRIEKGKLRTKSRMRLCFFGHLEFDLNIVAENPGYAYACVYRWTDAGKLITNPGIR